MQDCIFCKIVKGELPSTKVLETTSLLAFMDIKPINAGHVLIIPKKHAELASEVETETLGEIMVVGEKINNAIRKSGIKCGGIDFFLADGAEAGQEVPHVHLHIIPRFEKDGFGFKFPEGYEKIPKREELDELSEKIKKVL